mmetsp:Transcript_28060/g.41444  ORF Transcript_28060/g.41444 Transcript_28060/m.41444 type:complete len:234 (+) Transcript_28060:59-760(+)
MFRKKRTRRNKGGPVGTEAKAIASIERNSKNFSYPKESFESRIEYSLLYNMLEEPKVYPEEIVLNQISEEEFEEYLFVAGDEIAGERRVSYGQLSAILALASEKYPPQKEKNSEKQSVADAISKAVLRCVIKYVEDHDLDRQAELRELMQPVETHFIKRDNKSQLKSNIPFYLGYTATILTANPLPMLVGAAVMIDSGDKLSQERQNIESISKDSSRRADIEKTGLLDEGDEW